AVVVGNTGDAWDRHGVGGVVVVRLSRGDYENRSREDGDDLLRIGEPRVGPLGSVQELLEGAQSIGVHLGGIDHQSGRRLVVDTGDLPNLDRGGRELPRERDGLGRVVDSGVSLLRRSGESPVNKVQLVAVVLTIQVVAELGAVGQTEDLAGLLPDEDARSGCGGAVALTELVRVREGLDRTAELLG